VRIAKTPDVRPEICWKITPGTNGVIGDDQDVIVKNEAQDKRIDISEKGRKQNRYRQERLPPRESGARRAMHVELRLEFSNPWSMPHTITQETRVVHSFCREA